MKILKEEAVDAFGSVGKLAKALNIEHSAVSQWKNGKPIPPLRAYQVRDLLLEINPTALSAEVA